jgi:hypothetical protein
VRIQGRWKDLVHTHFVTDGERLGPERTREIERAFGSLLRQRGIVFPIHFARARHERTIRIVLECQPAQEELVHLEQELGRIIEPIPARPARVKSVKLEGS